MLVALDSCYWLQGSPAAHKHSTATLGPTAGLLTARCLASQVAQGKRETAPPRSGIGPIKCPRQEKPVVI